MLFSAFQELLMSLRTRPPSKQLHNKKPQTNQNSWTVLCSYDCICIYICYNNDLQGSEKCLWPQPPSSCSELPELLRFFLMANATFLASITNCGKLLFVSRELIDSATASGKWKRHLKIKCHINMSVKTIFRDRDSSRVVGMIGSSDNGSQSPYLYYRGDRSHIFNYGDKIIQLVMRAI